MDIPDTQYAARPTAYGVVSTHLSLLSDRRLAETVASAIPLGSGVGGRSGELDVAGVRVFVKRVPLTDVELLPRNARSTANLFDLPVFYHYGLGSTGFGAWRELAVHTMTTNWVLANRYEGFPLLYHWRVLPDSPPEGFADEFGGVDGAVAYWEGSPAVRERLEAIGRSSHSLVLFLEHLPQTLAEWLADPHHAAADGESEPPGLRVEEALVQGTTFMNSCGLVHFDAHFQNILTDGRLLYFTDFGLALSSGFELAADETAFLAGHRSYDRCYIAAHLLRDRLPADARGALERAEFLRGWNAGRRPGHIAPEDAAIFDRYGRAAAALDEFHQRLHSEDKCAAFPNAGIERLLDMLPPRGGDRAPEHPHATGRLDHEPICRCARHEPAPTRDSSG
jgi:hypothetical protein